MIRRTCTPPGASDRQDDPRAEASRCLATLVCDYCDICVLMCPDLCITRDPVTRHIVIDLDLCKGCGLCAHYCPKGAITMVPDL
jgi:Pyruvate/2-oxoacid:ferredoxin oxidoreductase delta subunit